MEQDTRPFKPKASVKKDLYKILLKEASEQQNRSVQYAAALRKQVNPDAVAILKSTHLDLLKKIHCLECANCCTTTPPIINKQDITRIARFLKISPRQFTRKYVLTDVNEEMSFQRVPCVFLNDNNSCSIYEVRPEACRRYPHTDEESWFSRSLLNVKNTLICPAAYMILNKIFESIISE